MASRIEDTLIQLDQLHSVDYKDDEVQLIKSKIEAIVNNISTKIGQLNPNLSNTVVPCGSFYHNSKISAPNEFDFLLVLNKFSDPSVCNYKPFNDPDYPQLVSVEIDHQKFEWEPDIFFEQDDDPKSKQAKIAGKVESDYRNAVRTILTAMQLPEGISFATSQKSVRVHLVEENRKYLGFLHFSGPALTLLLNWNGVKYPNLKISVDMTYVIQVEGLPSFCTFENRLSGDHPIEKAGLCTKANHHLLYTHMLDDTWRQTCTELENKIISFWFEKNDSSNVCYRLLKIIRDILMPVDQLGEAILKTYALKSAFLYECEQYPEARFWSCEQLSARLLSIFQRLLDGLQNRFLSNYFNESVNAFSYPFDAEPEAENSEDDNHFITSVYETTCQITQDIVRSLENNLCNDRYVQRWLDPEPRIVIANPDIPEPGIQF